MSSPRLLAAEELGTGSLRGNLRGGDGHGEAKCRFGEGGSGQRLVAAV